ncbi:sensor histidine kinase [Oceanobacillus sp. CFH 90083]|uniref:sensor histidine kinase n=1 Tax=Oceanobacillus sp. CFH 90083 TaxID=2592336 RepID=UPI00128B8500|nr:histidine kinase [Oceanobacillus sp. CFH 90083]
MKSYWIWLGLHIIVWLFAFLYLHENLTEMIWRLFGVSLFFILFFILPLLKNRPTVLTMLLAINACLSVITLFPGPYTGLNPFLILILTLLIAEAFQKSPYRLAFLVSGVSSIGMIYICYYTNAFLSIIAFILLYFVFLHAGLLLYKQNKDDKKDLFFRYDALLSEFRRLKRQAISEEEAARQEERNLIGHEIHDSVGHKLTALLVQLEAFRIQSSEQDQDHVTALKNLAQESLDETRSAVKALKNTNHGGLQGIIRLIRRLETESFIRTTFSVKYGAFAIPLNGEQSFVIYRSVQEALTNIMRHSQAREANISFAAPGGSVFRFEISNPVQDNRPFQEGFGLSEMRKRMENIGGHLEVRKTEEQFIVNGTLQITAGGEHNDKNIVSRRSGHGETGVKNDDRNR